MTVDIRVDMARMTFAKSIRISMFKFVFIGSNLA